MSYIHSEILADLRKLENRLENKKITEKQILMYLAELNYNEIQCAKNLTDRLQNETLIHLITNYIYQQ